MKNFCTRIVAILLIASVISGCASNKHIPGNAWDFRTLAKITNSDQLVIARAAIAVSQLKINNPSTASYSLDGYFSLQPEIYKRKNKGRSYVLVVFREENSKYNRGAYTLMQLCAGQLYDIEYGFGAKIDRSLIAGFVAPIGISGPDYLEVNLCESDKL